MFGITKKYFISRNINVENIYRLYFENLVKIKRLFLGIKSIENYFLNHHLTCAWTNSAGARCFERILQQVCSMNWSAARPIVLPWYFSDSLKMDRTHGPISSTLIPYIKELPIGIAGNEVKRKMKKISKE